MFSEGTNSTGVERILRRSEGTHEAKHFELRKKKRKNGDTCGRSPV